MVERGYISTALSRWSGVRQHKEPETPRTSPRQHAFEPWSKNTLLTILPVNIASIILGVLWLTPAVRACQYPDYQPNAATEYSSYQEQQGIGIAVVPMFDRSAQKHYLGTDFSARGFLPVYVVIENHGNPRGAILLRDHVLYGHDNSAPVSRSQQQAKPGTSGDMKTTAEMSAADQRRLAASISAGAELRAAEVNTKAGDNARAAANLRAASADLKAANSASLWDWAPGIIDGLMVAQAASKLSNVRMNLLKKELRSQTVSPGKGGGGFVLVPTGKGAKEVFLDVPVKDGASNEDIHFYFQIDMRSEGK